MAIHINKLDGGNITITTGGSAPVQHEETWYKYSGDTEWRTVMLGGTIALIDDMEIPTGQIENPTDIVAIEIGTGTQANPVTSIGDYAFSGCYELTSVTIPDSVTSIGDNAFDNCIGLVSVTIPNRVTSIGWGAFAGSGLTSVTIPASVTNIGSGAFSSCSGLTSVTIGNGVTSIGLDAFNSCSELSSVTFLGKTMKEIQDIEDENGNKQYPWGIYDTSFIHVA